MYDHKTLLSKNKRLMVLALSLTLVLLLYFIIWHYSGLRIIGSYEVTDVLDRFMELALFYLIISVILSSLLFMGLSVFSDRKYHAQKGVGSKGAGSINVEYDEKQIGKMKKVLGFYLHLYRNNLIIPSDYKVRFN